MEKLLLITVLALYSCRPEPIDNYKGAIIYDKRNPPINRIITMKCKEKDGYYFWEIVVLKVDYDKYEIGDTIK